MDEYKILQDKIDKIGGFRFTIKGWSVTAVIAASAAGAAGKSLSTALCLTVGLSVMLFFFFRFELGQVELSRIFGNRARKIEECFKLVDRNKGTTTTAPVLVPYSAHEIVQQRRQLSERDWYRRRTAGGIWDSWKRRWRVLKQADLSFYAVLVVLAFVLLLTPKYKAIYTHFKGLRSETRHSAQAASRPPCKPSRSS